jgi:hypothetical protein
MALALIRIGRRRSNCDGERRSNCDGERRSGGGRGTSVWEEKGEKKKI